MPAPPIQIFLTTIASQPALRQRQEYILRILQTKKIPFDSYDLASDEEAKRLWRRKAPVDKQQLPGILIGGTCPGSFTDFEEAVEFGELDIFLRRNDSWDPEIDELRPPPPVKPIGVPGAASPSQMAKPEHKRYFTPSPQPSPLKGKGGDRSASNALKPGDTGYQSVVDELHRRSEKEFDVGEELSGYGLQGVKVTEDDLLALVEELGLEGDEAGDLAKGLGGLTGLGGATKVSSASGGTQEKHPAKPAEATNKDELVGKAVEAGTVSSPVTTGAEAKAEEKSAINPEDEKTATEAGDVAAPTVEATSTS